MTRARFSTIAIFAILILTTLSLLRLRAENKAAESVNGTTVHVRGLFELRAGRCFAAETGPHPARARRGYRGSQRTRGLLEQRWMEGSLLIAVFQRPAER